ncbi:MAG: hypothetical protein JO180_00175 [Gemmatirosa sp.]|nr:hypothetical protein [Gemmatirosa sp.]
MRLRIGRLAAHAAVLAATACGPLHRGGPPAAVIVFDNQSLDQADVFAEHTSGNRVRIGTVMAGRRESLNIPGSATGSDHSVNIVARLLSTGRVLRTGLLNLGPGDRMAVTLPINGNLLGAVPDVKP